MLGKLKSVVQIANPFVELVLGAVGKAPDEAVWLVEENLRRLDDDALDWGINDDLPGEGIKSHLVVGFELVKEVRPGGNGSGFVIEDKEMIREGDDAV